MGDIVSFGQLTMAFMLIPVLQPERQKSALIDAVHYAEEFATGQEVPKDYANAAATARQMIDKSQFAEARTLVANHLVYEEAYNYEGWAQVHHLHFLPLQL